MLACWDSDYAPQASWFQAPAAVLTEYLLVCPPLPSHQQGSPYCLQHHVGLPGHWSALVWFPRALADAAPEIAGQESHSHKGYNVQLLPSGVPAASGYQNAASDGLSGLCGWNRS